MSQMSLLMLLFAQENKASGEFMMRIKGETVGHFQMAWGVGFGGFKAAWEYLLEYKTIMDCLYELVNESKLEGRGIFFCVR